MQQNPRVIILPNGMSGAANKIVMPHQKTPL
jgi:hypothetical protein